MSRRAARRAIGEVWHPMKEGRTYFIYDRVGAMVAATEKIDIVSETWEVLLTIPKVPSSHEPSVMSYRFAAAAALCRETRT